MDKNKIKSFAVSARNQLIENVKLRLAEIGISESKISDKLAKSTNDKEYYGEGQESNALIGKQINWRRDIINELNERDYENDPETAYKDFVEEVAYTWFNRIISIRFMEVNNYLPSRTRVLSSDEKGKNEPDIITDALEIEDDLGGYTESEKKIITDALTNHTPNMMDKAYTILFIKQCDALNQILPGLFEPTKGYLELLFAPHYDRGVIQDLLHMIPESYFDVAKKGQVQIIGWLYQYYNSELHDQVVNMNGNAIKKDEIAAATQLFTPDWIVKYMIDNSLGKYYLEHVSNSSIKSDLKYLLPDNIKNSSEDSNIINYKFLDNAMGSGHILVYAFDLFMKMYIEQGYSKRDAAVKIIENNLFGLEIDKRAYQLAYFSIMMKGREYDRRFFRRDVKNNLYYFSDLDINDGFYDLIDNQAIVDGLKTIVKEFSNATELGSIIKLDESINISQIKTTIEKLEIDDHLDVFSYKKTRKHILKTLDIIKVMSNKYTAVVTNPPYMNKFDKTLKKYLKDNYKDYAKDLFSVFIYHNMQLLAKDGYAGYMTPLVWMFIKTYEPLRKEVINNFKIDSLIQMEYSAFEEATVPIDSFVLKNSKEKVGTYVRLSNFKGGMTIQEQKVLEAVEKPTVEYLYHTDQTNFDKIPGSPIAYWASDKVIEDFEKNKDIYYYSISPSQNVTGNNKKYLRKFWEIDKHKVDTKDNWIFYAKGGGYRKWYGNLLNIINWTPEARKIYKYGDGKHASQIINEEYWYKEGITWGLITSNKSSFRVMPTGATFDKGGTTIIIKDEKYFYIIMALLNSKVLEQLISFLNPTINFQLRDISLIPLIVGNTDEINSKSKFAIKISKSDWDAFETSWDFQKSPLLNTNTTSLKQAYATWAEQALSRFNQLKANEEELNRIFINLYGLQDELTAKEDDKEVSVRKADQVRDIKAFLSYFIGCTFGRYSLDQDGLAYAGGKWDSTKYSTYIPNKDNIILLTDKAYFTDNRDIIVRLKEFLAATFSKDTVAENIDFIAQTLDPKKFEKGSNPDDIIRAYFVNDFYKDHDKTYQKRPIYWEFNSGRNKGFKALMYLHRYTPDQLAMVRKYLHDLQPIMNNTIEFNTQLLNDSTTSRSKNQSNKLITTITKQLTELIKYDQVLDHLSQKAIALNLDDGVLVNHEKLQQGEKILSKL